MPETVGYLCQYAGLMLSHLLLLPCCMSIAGYCVKVKSEGANKLHIVSLCSKEKVGATVLPFSGVYPLDSPNMV